MINEITARRSIRKFKGDDLSDEIILDVLNAARLAPSSKNRQPWKFIVVRGDSKVELLDAMAAGLDREENGQAILPDSRRHLKAARYTLDIMRSAPVTILVINTLGLSLDASLNPEQRIYEICNAQSIGAAIENMTLTAAGLDVGSLWICDIFFAHEELNEWAGTGGELIAALTLGYADEAPGQRPRRAIGDIVEWRN